MIVLLALLFFIFCVITVRDIRTRLIHVSDLLALCMFRMAVLVVSLLSFPGVDAARWGVGSLLESFLLAAVLAGAFCLLGKGVSKITNGPALGRGDVLLLAACCLFLNLQCIDAYLVAMAAFGIVLSLVWLIAKKDKTFPFAPALVWPCWLLILMA